MRNAHDAQEIFFKLIYYNKLTFVVKTGIP